MATMNLRFILIIPALICVLFAASIGGATLIGYASGDPHGAWLTYTGNEIDGIGDIMLYDVMHGRTINLTQTPTQNETRAMWSPDGRWLAFECDYPRQQRGFCLLDMAARPYRHYRGGHGYRPMWSPDGKYLSWIESDAGRYVLHTAAFDPLAQNVVGVDSVVGEIYSAMEYGWLADSTSLVYSSYTSQLSRVYITDYAGLQPREVPQPTRNNFEPIPSPDGRWIAYVTVVGYNRRIALLDTTTDEYSVITDGGGIGNDFSPLWSPDGTRLIFLSDRDGADFDIFILDMDDREEHQLTANYFLDDNLAVSPDGEKIALMSNRDGAFHIYILNLIDGTTTRVTTDGAANNFPVWRP